MKIILVLLLFLPITLYSQNFKVYCGKDTTFCKSINDTTSKYFITNIIVENGVEPYSFKWSCNDYRVSTNYTMSAADFLNDTTLQNPYFKDFPIDDDFITFKLTVTDKNDNIALDSVSVRFSRFGYLPAYSQYSVYQGDSIRLGGEYIGGGIQPLKYFWSPSVFLSDSTESSPICKPINSTDYFQVAIDSVGCKSEPSLVYRILVVPNALNSETKHKSIQAYQAGSKLIFENVENENVKLSFYSLEGRKLAYFEAKSNSVDLEELHLPKGIYVFSLECNNAIITGKFIHFSKP